MDRKLLDILVCPGKRQPARPARQTGLETLNRSIAAASVGASTAARSPIPLREALVTQDRRRCTGSTPASRCCWSRKASPPPGARILTNADCAPPRRRRHRRRQAAIAADVAGALAEDLGSGDVTAALLPDRTDIAYLLCKENAVVCGRPWFDACHRALDAEVRIDWRVSEGDRVAQGAVLATLEGRARALVSAERASLNFMQTLSGTATITAAYVDAVRGTGARILDTRKTLPGLRLAQKYAVRWAAASTTVSSVRCGMLKENHIRAAARSARRSLQRARLRRRCR